MIKLRTNEDVKIASKIEIIRAMLDAMRHLSQHNIDKTPNNYHH